MTKNNLIYRNGTTSDVDQLQSLGIIAYGQFQSVLTPDNWTLFNGNLQDKQKFIDLLKIARCFVCLDNDKIVGVAYIIPSGNPTDLFKSEWSYIRMVGVNPTYRGQGIAKALTQMCIDFAKQSNEKTIALHTSEFMDAARHIYENIGFKVLKEIPTLFGKKYWLYTLDLN
ncbi:MAG: putative acetyltransferase, family [Bacteroidetes bacterium]|jgi:ribosomal protein S18 acetylase RimI-like enzyme|nr:putative acetyltransferase, family [Bacteroidota bacterium]